MKDFWLCIEFCHKIWLKTEIVTEVYGNESLRCYDVKSRLALSCHFSHEQRDYGWSIGLEVVLIIAFVQLHLILSVASMHVQILLVVFWMIAMVRFATVVSIVNIPSGICWSIISENSSLPSSNIVFPHHCYSNFRRNSSKSNTSFSSKRHKQRYIILVPEQNDLYGILDSAKVSFMNQN